MSGEIKEIRKADINHRKQYEKFVLENGDTTVSKLIHVWNYWNRAFFDNSFKACPIILLAEPSKPSRLGDYSPVGAYGSKAQIRIRPSLLSGTHPHTLPGHEYEGGRFFFVADVCLHETIHLWQDEVMGDLEENYHGHGPLFRDKCNEIGEKMGLPPVRTCKKRGKDAELPSCSQFPHNVRPPDYYQGAYIGMNGEPKPLRGRLERLLKVFTSDEILQELKAMRILETWNQYQEQPDNPLEIFSATKTAADEPFLLKHLWFLDTFNTACRKKGINPDLRLTATLAHTLEEWIDKRLSQGRYLGETDSNIAEKLRLIISEWESIRIFTPFDQPIEMPPVPDLTVLIANREPMFRWMEEQMQIRLDKALAQPALNLN